MTTLPQPGIQAATVTADNSRMARRFDRAPKHDPFRKPKRSESTMPEYPRVKELATAVRVQIGMEVEPFRVTALDDGNDWNRRIT